MSWNHSVHAGFSHLRTYSWGWFTSKSAQTDANSAIIVAGIAGSRQRERLHSLPCFTKACFNGACDNQILRHFISFAVNPAAQV